MRRLLLIVSLLALIAPSAAASDGLPTTTNQGGLTGVTAPGVDARYVSVQTGRNTLVEKLQAGRGIVAYRQLRGYQTIPTVAMDGSASGLSRSDGTLVLLRPPNGRSTGLTVLSGVSLHPMARITLRGWWTFDAISPDGSTAFLVHYTAPNRDLGQYEVRAYDLNRGRLLPHPVVDPNEKQMHGMPMTRAMSPDGRWAYTLYQGPDENFIHALDTVGRTARCIDLDLAGDVSDLRMRVVGGRLEIRGLTQTVAAVDTRTNRVVPVREAAAVPPTAPGGSGFPWWALALALAAIGAGAAALRWRAPSSSAPAPPASARRPG